MSDEHEAIHTLFGWYNTLLIGLVCSLKSNMNLLYGTSNTASEQSSDPDISLYESMLNTAELTGALCYCYCVIIRRLWVVNNLDVQSLDAVMKLSPVWLNATWLIGKSNWSWRLLCALITWCCPSLPILYRRTVESTEEDANVVPAGCIAIDVIALECPITF